MSEMIERVARTLSNARWADLDDDETARAVLAVMREPTDAMVTKGWELLRGNLRPDEIFPYMIDEALK